MERTSLSITTLERTRVLPIQRGRRRSVGLKHADRKRTPGSAANSQSEFLNSSVNGPGAVNPFGLDRSQAWTADQNHSDLPEQEAVNHGLMDSFPHSVGTGRPPPPRRGVFSTTGLNFGYYDGNTVTALWNYAQHYALADNAFASNYGPSIPGALNLIAGQTNGIVPTDILNGQSNSEWEAAAVSRP